MIKATVTAVVLVLGGWGIYAWSHSDDKPVQEVMMKKDEKAMVAPTSTSMMDKKDDSMMSSYTGRVLAGNAAPLLNFTKADYDKAVTSNKLVVLYFYASWCPLCKEEFPKMEKAFDGLATNQVIGFRVNYKDSDTDQDEIALAREFGIAYQHTKVFIRGGKQVLKSPESWDETRYVKEINGALTK